MTPIVKLGLLLILALCDLAPAMAGGPIVPKPPPKEPTAKPAPPKKAPPKLAPPKKETTPSLVWVTVPAGRVLVGDDKWTGSKPRFRVKFTAPFQMLETEVTNRQYAAKNPRHSPVDDKPVANVDWKGAKAYCEAIDARLPTELEWEYAARAGGEGPYGLGQGREEVTEVNLRSYAWLSPTDGYDVSATTHPVRQKKPNAWGLYDMWGNVWEWVEDEYSAETWATLSASGTLLSDGTRLVTDSGFVNTIGDTNGSSPPASRVLRGGSAGIVPRRLRSGSRDGNGPADTNGLLGFRCVLAPAPQPLNVEP